MPTASFRFATPTFPHNPRRRLRGQLLRFRKCIQIMNMGPQVTKTKRHRCSVCEQGFARREHLTRHLRRHTLERPYQCPLCQRCFSRKETHDRHQRIEHDRDADGLLPPLIVESSGLSSWVSLDSAQRDVPSPPRPAESPNLHSDTNAIHNADARSLNAKTPTPVPDHELRTGVNDDADAGDRQNLQGSPAVQSEPATGFETSPALETSDGYRHMILPRVTDSQEELPLGTLFSPPSPDQLLAIDHMRNLMLKELSSRNM